MSNTISHWLSAFRLRTLPLAFSCIITGSFLAALYTFKWEITLLALLTTLFLQILSNLSNDYGDTVHGADSADRIGPQRAVQSGNISKASMKMAMIVCALLALISGLSLLYVALDNVKTILIFLLLGLSAIAAAIKYTAGKNPYGYKGLGDLFVFIFFGIVGVEGVFFLHTQDFSVNGLLPASAIGLLSVAVLNLNNMRDHVSDAKAGKNTLVVKMGFETAKKYHATLIVLAFLCALAFSILMWVDTGVVLPFIHLLVFVFLFAHLKKVFATTNPALLDPELKKVALSTFIFSILFGIGLML
jgi:1,4-dihydroxy-2-naphthoate polyprenyltransferase